MPVINGAYRKPFPLIVQCVLLGFYGLFTLFTAYSTVIDLIHASDMRYGPIPGTWLPLDLWAFAAALGLGSLAFVTWSNKLRFTLGSLCLGMMLGRMTIASLMFPVGLQLPGIWFFFLVPPVYVIGGFITLVVLTFSLMALGAFIFGIPVFLFHQLAAFDRSSREFEYQTNGLSGYLGAFIRWLNNLPRPVPLPDETRGARFATDYEVKEMIDGRPGFIIAGYTLHDVVYPNDIYRALALNTQKHILIMASTRSGKGTTVIIPHLLIYPGSVFVLDPKGENARATYRQRMKLSQKNVHVLDPLGITGLPKSRFNPFSSFTPDNAEEKSRALAAALFVEDADQDHWTRAGQQLLALFIMFVYFNKGIPDKHRDLAMLRKVILEQVKQALNTMQDDMPKEANGLLKALATSFLDIPPREFGSIVSSAQRQTSFLDNPLIQASLAASGEAPEVDFKQYKTGNMSVFLCLPAPMFPIFNRWMRLIAGAALDEMTTVLAPPPIPVSFVLDEIAQLRRMASIENAIALAAGYGCRLMTVWQDVAQMEDTYKDRWPSFVGNSALKIVFNLDDFASAEYWSKSLGNRTVENYGRNEDNYGMSQGRSVSDIQRPLMSPEEIMLDLAHRKILVIMQGHHPVLADRFAYYDNETLKGLWDDPRVAPGTPNPATPQPSGDFLKTGISGYSAKIAQLDASP